MDFEQVEILKTLFENNLIISDTSKIIGKSPDQIKSAIHTIENNLGTKIFIPNENGRLRLSEAGRGVKEIVDRINTEVRNIKLYTAHLRSSGRGVLKIGTTHNQAKYIIPSIYPLFAEKYPDVELEFIQDNPVNIRNALQAGEVDIAIATEVLETTADIIALPCFKWNHLVIAPKGHPILTANLPTIYDIAKYPIITYTQGFTGRTQIDAAFETENIEPYIKFSALDADIIKTYVKLNAGIGIISETALQNPLEDGFEILDNSRFIFPTSCTKFSLRRGTYISSHLGYFISLLSPLISIDNNNGLLKVTDFFEKNIAMTKFENSTLSYRQWSSRGLLGAEQQTGRKLYAV